MPEMIYVTSSNIEAIGYDEQSRELYVTFTWGGSYVYDDVPKHVFSQFLGASSKGSYLNQEIKGVYPYRQL